MLRRMTLCVATLLGRNRALEVIVGAATEIISAHNAMRMQFRMETLVAAAELVRGAHKARQELKFEFATGFVLHLDSWQDT